MPPTSRNRSALLIVILVLVATVFEPAIDAGFLEWDDDHNVYANPHLSPLNSDNLRWMFLDVGRDTRYKALSWLAWSLLQKSFGLHAPAFHMANVIIHAINAGLLLLLLMRLLTVAGVATSPHRALAAAAASLFWAIHPLRVEPVAWITGLPYHLSLLFLLLALAAYLHLDFKRSVFRQPRYWLTLFLQLCAMLSYPMPAGAIAIFIGLNIHPLRRISLSGWRSVAQPGNLRVALELLPLLLVSAALMAASIWGAHVRQGIHAPPPTLEEFSIGHRLAQAGYIWFYYLWKPLWPTDISPVYQTFSGFDPASPGFVFSSFAVVGLSFLAWQWRTRRPAFTAFWVAHLGILVPVLGVNVLGHVPADRYGIIHGVLISAALAFFLARQHAEQNRTALLTVLAAVLIIFANQSRGLCHNWHDNVTFFTNQLESLPPGGAKAQAHIRLGGELARRGDHANAIRHYHAAREAYPAAAIALLPYRHAESLYALGRFGEAVVKYQEAARLRPTAHDVWYGMVESLVQLGRLEDAANICRARAREYPDITVYAEELDRIEALKRR